MLCTQIDSFATYSMTTAESQIEQNLIAKLGELKYTSRPDIRDKAALEQNFRDKFEVLNRVHLTDAAAFPGHGLGGERWVGNWITIRRLNHCIILLR